MATRTAMATVPAATRPMTPRKGIPVMVRAERAMITVSPAKVTALPEVPTESAIDCVTGIPCMSCWRCRLRRNSE